MTKNAASDGKQRPTRHSCETRRAASLRRKSGRTQGVILEGHQYTFKRRKQRALCLCDAGFSAMLSFSERGGSWSDVTRAARAPPERPCGNTRLQNYLCVGLVLLSSRQTKSIPVSIRTSLCPNLFVQVQHLTRPMCVVTGYNHKEL